MTKTLDKATEVETPTEYLEEEQRRGLRPYFGEMISGTQIQTYDGPLTHIQAGQQCIVYRRETLAQLFFGGKWKPIKPGIPATGLYISKQTKRVIINGRYQQLHIGDTVELSFEEAFEALKARSVIPVDDSVFRI